MPDRSITQRAGVAGLGTGTMACHARRGDHWTFYEIDEAVVRVARDPALFTYLKKCRGKYDVELGDARLSLGRERDGRFGFLALDAFSSDAIPIHLLTREAVDPTAASWPPTECSRCTSRTSTSTSSRRSGTWPTRRGWRATRSRTWPRRRTS